MSAPTLTTERLILRPQTVEDLEPAAAMWADEEVTRHIGGMPRPRHEVWTTLLRAVGHWQLMGYGYWIVERRGTGEFLGEAGFADQKRALPPELVTGPEAGWAFTRAAWGQGIATEAMRAALDWMNATHAPAATHCIIDPGNAASQKVAAKLGYVLAGETLLRGEIVRVYRRGY